MLRSPIGTRSQSTSVTPTPIISTPTNTSTSLTIKDSISPTNTASKRLTFTTATPIIPPTTNLIYQNMELLKTLIPSIPTLKDYKTNISNYIFRVERLLARVETADKIRLLNLIVDRFGNEGLNAVRQLSTEDLANWDEVKKALKDAFSKTLTATNAQEQLQNTKNEGIRQYMMQTRRSQRSTRAGFH